MRWVSSRHQSPFASSARPRSSSPSLIALLSFLREHQASGAHIILIFIDFVMIDMLECSMPRQLIVSSRVPTSEFMMLY